MHLLACGHEGEIRLDWCGGGRWAQSLIYKLFELVEFAFSLVFDQRFFGLRGRIFDLNLDLRWGILLGFRSF